MKGDRMSTAVDAAPKGWQAMKVGGKGKKGQNPKKFVISFRVNAEEWELLKQRTEDSDISLSTFMRSCIQRLTQNERQQL
jgi:hypothetical protein